MNNKHVVIAMLVAPVLALIAYFGVDSVVSEPPHSAQPGESYQLVAGPKCRYTSGVCVLKNGNFRLTLIPETLPDGVVKITMTSAFPLQGARLALVSSPEADKAPESMQSVTDDGMRWQVLLRSPMSENAEIRLVASANEALYYGTAGTAFMVYKTSYGEDFRQTSD